VKRREFVTVLGVAAAWPLAGHAQQPERLRRVGVLIGFPENDPAAQARVAAFAQALGRFGWVEGKNIQIDYRFAADDPTRYQTYAEELVGLAPDAILANSTPGVAALRKQTHTIPIVFAVVADPVGQGFVQSLAHPGGNITMFGANDPTLMGNGCNCSRRSRQLSRGWSRSSIRTPPRPYCSTSRSRLPARLSG